MDARYLCSNCERPITTEKVVRIEAEPKPGPGDAGSTDGKTGYMLITHYCSCSALVLTSRRHASYQGFVALFGRGVALPYESPFSPTEVDDENPLLVRWRWELEQTHDVEEFVFWLDQRRPSPSGHQEP